MQPLRDEELQRRFDLVLKNSFMSNETVTSLMAKKQAAIVNQIERQRQEAIVIEESAIRQIKLKYFDGVRKGQIKLMKSSANICIISQASSSKREVHERAIEIFKERYGHRFQDTWDIRLGPKGNVLLCFILPLPGVGLLRKGLVTIIQ